MPPLSGNGQRRRPGNGMNRWNNDQRLTLHLLHSRFELSIGERTRIFNTIFAEHLRGCGVTEGLKQTGITAQYAERTKPTGAAAWRAICAEPATTVEAAKRDLIAEQIARVARTLSISVRRISATGSAMPQPQHREAPGKRGRPRTTTSVEEDLRNINLADSDEDDVPTPTPKRVKRAASEMSKWTFKPAHDKVATSTESDADADFVLVEPSKPAKRIRTDPVVVIPTIPKRRGRPPKGATSSAGLPSPSKTPSSIAIRKAKATIEYPRPNGTIMLTPDEFKVTKQPLVPPSESDVHPPLAGLLFRYWTDDCFSKLNERGEFVAGKFAKFSTSGTESPPLPTMKDFKYFWHDVGAHMNREPVHSPWISTCNQLTWIIRLAVQESKKGVTSGRITVLNAHAIDRHALFHAQPLHKELCKKKPFDKGAFRYQGMREFLVFYKIPKQAVLHTFTVQDLLQLTVSKPAVGDLLRLHHLSKSMTAMKTLTQTLEAQDLKLQSHTISAIAAVVRFLGLKADAPTEHIMHIVSDIVQGWSLAVAYQTPHQWSAMADVFASAIVTPSGTSWIKDYQRMKIAFLDGVRWSQGDVNARHKVERMQTMLGRAKKIGLDNPAKILSDELDAAKLGIMMYDQKQQRLLQGSASQALLGGSEDEDDILPITPSPAGFDVDDEITYDSDAD